jgi:hypothetical protein
MDESAPQFLTPEQKLVEMKAQYEASPARVLERAQAELARRQGDPYHENRALTDPSEQANRSKLRSQIAVAEADLAKALVNQLDPTDLALVGALPDGWVETGPGAWLADQVSAVPSLRDAGLRDEAIRQILSDQTVSKIEYDAVEKLHKRRMADPAWCAKLLANDYDTVRESLLMSAVLAAEITA